MTEDEKKLCVRVLASVAWADGSVSGGEMKHLENEVLRLGYDNPTGVAMRDLSRLGESCSYSGCGGEG